MLRVDEATGDTVADEEEPNQICTALADEDGSQFLTFTIPRSSSLADEAYRFFVPGVDGAEMEVLVP